MAYSCAYGLRSLAFGSRVPARRHSRPPLQHGVSVVAACGAASRVVLNQVSAYLTRTAVRERASRAVRPRPRHRCLPGVMFAADGLLGGGDDGGRRAPEHPAQSVDFICGSQRLQNNAIYEYTASLPFALLAHQLHQRPRFVNEE